MTIHCCQHNPHLPIDPFPIYRFRKQMFPDMEITQQKQNQLFNEYLTFFVITLSSLHYHVSPL